MRSELLRIVTADRAWSELGLRAVAQIQLRPREFLPQTNAPHLAGVCCLPGSAPVVLSHRKLGSRTQTRSTLQPGDCQLRLLAAREGWTFAVPPLLPETDEVTRCILLLVEACSCMTEQEVVRSLSIKTHEVDRLV